MKTKLKPSSRRTRQVEVNPIDFLSRYGYLRSDSAVNPITNDELVAAFSLYQSRNNLEIRGRMTAETRRLMLKPRCGVPDIFNDQEKPQILARDEAPRKPVGLHNPVRCPWTGVQELKYWFGTMVLVQISSNYLPPTPQAFKTEVWKAFQKWNRQLGLIKAPFKFSEASNGVNADILVEGLFQVNDNHLGFPLSSSDLAHADFPPRCGYMPVPKFLHFETGGTKWAEQVKQHCYDIQSVALHEIGHLLGLVHASPEDDVMNPTFDREQVKQSLSTNDRAQLKLLYP